MAEKSTDPRITNRAGKSSRNALIVALVVIVGVLIFAVMSGQKAAARAACRDGFLARRYVRNTALSNV